MFILVWCRTIIMKHTMRIEFATFAIVCETSSLNISVGIHSHVISSSHADSMDSLDSCHSSLPAGSSIGDPVFIQG